MGCNCCKKQRRLNEEKAKILADSAIKFNLGLLPKIKTNNTTKNTIGLTSKNKSPILNFSSNEKERRFSFENNNHYNEDEDSLDSISINKEKLNTRSPDNFASVNQQTTNTTDDYFSSEELDYYFHLNKENNNRNFSYYEISFDTVIEKGELIGQGGFGRVYTGFDKKEGRIVAVKEIKVNEEVKNTSRIVNIEREIQILSTLHHKNVVKYYGVQHSDSIVSIILEYCMGGSLAKHISTYKKVYHNEKLIRRHLKQILEGLEYLHSNNIIHRDIKAANILVDGRGVCKLSDFGGAKSIVEENSSRKSHVFMGTPNWLAPESVKAKEYSRFSDIWAIGCLVIEMVTGEPPWSNYRNPMAVLFQLYNNKNPPPIPDSVSDDLRDFISCCLQMEPKKRLNVYKLLRHPFISNNKNSNYTSNYYSNNNNINIKNENSNKLSVLNQNLKIRISNLNIKEKNIDENKNKVYSPSDYSNNVVSSTDNSKNNSGDSYKSKISKNFFSKQEINTNLKESLNTHSNNYITNNNSSNSNNCIQHSRDISFLEFKQSVISNKANNTNNADNVNNTDNLVFNCISNIRNIINRKNNSNGNNSNSTKLISKLIESNNNKNDINTNNLKSASKNNTNNNTNNNTDNYTSNSSLNSNDKSDKGAKVVIMKKNNNSNNHSKIRNSIINNLSKTELRLISTSNANVNVKKIIIHENNNENLDNIDNNSDFSSNSNSINNTNILDNNINDELLSKKKS